MKHIFKDSPQAVAHDLHPDYRSTRMALASGIERKFPVHHHHAHIASCMAENHLRGRYRTLNGWHSLAVEFLVADLAGFERRAHLRAVPLPGGDVAARQPWRKGPEPLPLPEPSSARAYVADLRRQGFGVFFCSFGDMLRVPGSDGALVSMKPLGGAARIVYSPLDCLKIACANPQKQVVFFAIGFETTAPTNAMLAWRAREEQVNACDLPRREGLHPHAARPDARRCCDYAQRDRQMRHRWHGAR